MNIAISNDIYNAATLYAQEHNTSLKDIVENYLRRLRPVSVKVDDADIKLQNLIALTSGLTLDADDLNGNKGKQKYMRNKYLQ